MIFEGSCDRCGHDWREHEPDEGCGECRYEIEHDEPDAPAAVCPAPLMDGTSNKVRRDAHRFYERLGFVASHEGLKPPLR